MKKLFLIIALLCPLLLPAQEEVFRKIQTRLIEAADGDTIQLPAGTYRFNRSLLLDDKKNITLLGAGKNASIFDFSEQIDGAEGLKINRCENVSLIGFTIRNAKGDCIKMLNTSRIYVYKVKTEWTAKPGPKNGAYGFYPVSCTDVVLDSCTAIGASDAGIYVGQSTRVEVRRCEAFYNVAGIEIENCRDARVYECLAKNNTGGILVFDLPELPMKKGGNIEVYNNTVIENNYRNFAPKGNIVGEVPPGTGVLVLACSDVKVYRNRIINNRTASCGIVSFYLSQRPYKDEAYDPLPQNVEVYNNHFERDKKYKPSKQTQMGLLIWFKLKKDTPFILYDGIWDKDQRKIEENPANICVYNNSNESFVQIDAANKFKNMSRDAGPYRCKK